MKKVFSKIYVIFLIMLTFFCSTACDNSKTYSADEILMQAESMLTLDYTSATTLKDSQNSILSQEETYYNIATPELIEYVQYIQGFWQFCESGKTNESHQDVMGTVTEIATKIQNGYNFVYQFDYELSDYGDEISTYNLTFNKQHFQVNATIHKNDLDYEVKIDFLHIKEGTFIQYYKTLENDKFSLVKYFQDESSLKYSTNIVKQDGELEYSEMPMTDCENFVLPEFDYIVCHNK